MVCLESLFGCIAIFGFVCPVITRGRIWIRGLSVGQNSERLYSGEPRDERPCARRGQAAHGLGLEAFYSGVVLCPRCVSGVELRGSVRLEPHLGFFQVAILELFIFSFGLGYLNHYSQQPGQIVLRIQPEESMDSLNLRLTYQAI